MRNSRTITRQGEDRRQVQRTILAMFEDSMKQTAPYQVGDVDPRRADELTAAMIAAGLLVPVKLGQNVRGLSFMPVETTDTYGTSSTDGHRL